ncbi:V-type ATP synthase subunit I [Anaerocolumna aminovalerica]|uniref:V/A-type H+-transporting ATPase subunit I n=1 Tax=Anaerocolumna aminovalerica TaxID=1527 RepID=A0A1I5G469_9FIRM|nr:V-type ATP synthase subunit I [Anaerocolumna aminovalerica]MBU5331239.1 V-type ATP synthase subunit I [Anaerocolumna aminovalerica]MDU6264277.1 V-type ATP synthase subunit I [Anaerocolumna aminovalerica]SFO30825.1 V/A-type H+-transporting ATPase subunit I [Anaerocolumna aminovalerica]
MAIVKMNRFSLFVFESDKENLLHELQKFNYVHFLDLKENTDYVEMGLENAKVPENIVRLNEEITKVKYGLEKLSKYDTRATGLKAMKEGKEVLEFTELEERAENFNYQPIYEKLKEIGSSLDAIKSEKEKLNSTMNELRPWAGLDVAVSELGSTKQCITLMGTIPRNTRDSMEKELLESQYTYYEVIGEEKGYIYILVISAKEEADQVMEILRNHSFTETRLGIGDIPNKEMDVILNRISELKEEESNCEKQLTELGKYLPNLELLYDYYMNNKLRIASSENFLMAGNVNIIEGYVPADMINEFTDIVKKNLNNVYFMEIKEADKEDEEVPILLKNSTFSKPYESLTTMYALPKYNEIDPTPLFTPFYIFFFGMMIADMGYGLLLALGTGIALKTFNLSKEQRKNMLFYFYGSIATIFWGAIYGSFFGGIIPLPALIDVAVEYNRLLIISIAFGILHIFIALGIHAYLNIRDGKILDALYDVGFWYMALIGAILLLLTTTGILYGGIKNVAAVIMAIGMIGIVLTGGRSSESIGGKIGGGLYSLYGISSYVGDFVSYSRLMALGLSGAFIASAINMMAKMLFDMGIFGIIGGIVVFAVGHSFNVFLSVLSGYVHSIRLTYVEFFGKFYEGGGKAFKLLQSKPKYTNLKE